MANGYQQLDQSVRQAFDPLRAHLDAKLALAQQQFLRHQALADKEAERAFQASQQTQQLSAAKERADIIAGAQTGWRTAQDMREDKRRLMAAGFKQREGQSDEDFITENWPQLPQAEAKFIQPLIDKENELLAVYQQAEQGLSDAESKAIEAEVEAALNVIRNAKKGKAALAQFEQARAVMGPAAALATVIPLLDPGDQALVSQARTQAAEASRNSIVGPAFARLQLASDNLRSGQEGIRTGLNVLLRQYPSGLAHVDWLKGPAAPVKPAGSVQNEIEALRKMMELARAKPAAQAPAQAPAAAPAELRPPVVRPLTEAGILGQLSDYGKQLYQTKLGLSPQYNPVVREHLEALKRNIVQPTSRFLFGSPSARPQAVPGEIVTPQPNTLMTVPAGAAIPPELDPRWLPYLQTDYGPKFRLP